MWFCLQLQLSKVTHIIILTRSHRMHRHLPRSSKTIGTEQTTDNKKIFNVALVISTTGSPLHKTRVGWENCSKTSVKYPPDFQSLEYAHYNFCRWLRLFSLPKIEGPSDDTKLHLIRLHFWGFGGVQSYLYAAIIKLFVLNKAMHKKWQKSKETTSQKC